MKFSHTIVKLTILILLSIVSVGAASGDVSIVKWSSSEDVQVNQPISIYYNITNTYSEPVIVQMTDNAVLGGSGVEIQCLERTIAAQSSQVLTIDGVLSYEPGTFTLNPATITYTDPVKQTSSKVQSNSLEIKIEGPKPAAQVMKKVQQIYQCNGQNYQSTQISMSQSEQNTQNTPPGGQSSKQTQDKLNNMQQMNQNTQQLKQEMQQAQKQQEQRNSQLSKQIENNTNFQRMSKNLQDNGFQPKSKDIQASGNNSGSFEYQYENPSTHQKESIVGNMKNGVMENIQSSHDLKQQLMQKETYAANKKALNDMGFKPENEPRINKDGTFSQSFINNASEKASMNGNFNGSVSNLKTNFNNKALEQLIMQEQSSLNKQLKEFDQNMRSKGYESKPMNFSMENGKTDSFTKKYVNPKNGESIEVKGKLNKTTITKSNLVNEKKSWWLYILGGLTVIALMGILALRRNTPVKEQVTIHPKDPHKEAINLLRQAKILYDLQPKEAYALCAKAVRVYFQIKNNTQKEWTNTELLIYLKSKVSPVEHKQIQHVLNQASMVEFARYETNDKDFNSLYKGSVEIVKR